MYSKLVKDGYRMTQVFYDKPLTRMPYAQAGVIIEKGKTVLMSYTTPVIILWTDETTGHRMLDCTGTYSTTTRKHIGAFCREYAPTVGYYDCKAAFEGQYSLDLDTGEKRPFPAVPMARNIRII